MREKSTGKPARPRTNCWEMPVKERCTRSKMFAMQTLGDKKPLKAFEAAIHRPIYNKNATIPTQTEMPSSGKDAETFMPKCTTDAELAACKVHPFYFAQFCGDPILVEQYVGKKPDRKELMMERARQARQAATSPAAGQPTAYVPAETVDLDMIFVEAPMYHTLQDFLPITSVTSMGSLSAESSHDEEDNVLEMSQAEDVENDASPTQQQNVAQPVTTAGTLQVPSTAGPTEREEHTVLTSPAEPAAVTSEDLNQIIDVVIERATRNLPARQAETTTLVNLMGKLDTGSEKLQTQVQATVRSKRAGKPVLSQKPMYRAGWVSTVTSQPVLTHKLTTPLPTQTAEPATTCPIEWESDASSPIEATNTSLAAQIMQLYPKAQEQEEARMVTEPFAIVEQSAVTTAGELTEGLPPEP